MRQVLPNITSPIIAARAIATFCGTALMLVLVAGLTLGEPERTALAADDTPVVLELFTSQGCSSCPEADKILGDIAAMRDDVIALSVHVNYWDYMGWEDPFASPATTERQHAYKAAMGLKYVYTPQLVINGRRHVVGSERDEIVSRIADAKAETEVGLAIRISPMGDGAVRVYVPADDSATRENKAVIWIVSFDREHRTTVTAGENAGRELANHRVVRSFRKLADWQGEAVEIPLSAQELRASGSDGCAILVQAGDGSGAIIGARQIWLDQGLF